MSYTSKLSQLIFTIVTKGKTFIFRFAQDNFYKQDTNFSTGENQNEYLKVKHLLFCCCIFSISFFVKLVNHFVLTFFKFFGIVPSNCSHLDKWSMFLILQLRRNIYWLFIFMNLCFVSHFCSIIYILTTTPEQELQS